MLSEAHKVPRKLHHQDVMYIYIHAIFKDKNKINAYICVGIITLNASVRMYMQRDMH